MELYGNALFRKVRQVSAKHESNNFGSEKSNLCDGRGRGSQAALADPAQELPAESWYARWKTRAEGGTSETGESALDERGADRASRAQAESP